MIYKYETISQSYAKLKLEISTTEHFQVLPFRTESFAIESEWFRGETSITTYEIDELIATKLRALYQRRKGRDLFDIWYVMMHKLVDLKKVFEIFDQYCAYNNVYISGEDFRRNLDQKKANRDFQTDMQTLLPSKLNWNFDKAYHFVVENVISRLP